MKQNLLMRLGIGATMLSLLAACGGDRHGSAGVPRPAELTGLWVSDAAWTEYRSAGSLEKFCRVALTNSALHGLEGSFNGQPTARILAVIPGGYVYRWYPGISAVDLDTRNQSLLGRVDNVGRAQAAGYGRAQIGRLRFTDFNHIVQDDGEDLFLNPNSPRRANTRPWDAYASKQIAPSRGFTRISVAEGRKYVERVRLCDPRQYPNEQRPAAQEPAPGLPVPTRPGTAPRPAVPVAPAPAAPAAQAPGGALPPTWQNEAEPMAGDEQPGADLPGAPATPPAPTAGAAAGGAASGNTAPRGRSRKPAPKAPEVERAEPPRDAAPGYLPKDER